MISKGLIPLKEQLDGDSSLTETNKQRKFLKKVIQTQAAQREWTVISSPPATSDIIQEEIKEL